MNCGLFSIFFYPRFLVQQRLLMSGFKFLVKMTSKKLFNSFIRYVLVVNDFIVYVVMLIAYSYLFRFSDHFFFGG